MIEYYSHELFDWLLPFIGKGFLLLAVPCLATLVWKRMPVSWRVVLAALALASVGTLFPPAWTWRHSATAGWQEAVRQVKGLRVAFATGNPPPPATLSAPDAAHGTESHRSAAESPPAVDSTVRIPSSWPLIVVLAGGWALGSALVLSWAGWGFLLARRWRVSARRLDGPEWENLLAETMASIGLKTRPLLLESALAPGPCVLGAWRPAILLPESSRAWDEETRRLVLRHELAHVARRDGWLAWLRTAMLVLHWINPLVWWTVARVRREEERAADDAVLAGGVTPARYASLLVRMARDHGASRRPAVGIAMARPSTVGRRVRDLLASGSGRPPARLRGRWTGALAVLLLAGGVGCGGLGQKRPFFEQWPREAIEDKALAHLVSQPDIKGRLVRVHLRVVDRTGRELSVRMPGAGLMGDRPLSMSTSIRLPLNQSGRVENIREFIYPTGYELPQFPPDSPPGIPGEPSGQDESQGVFPVTPTTPVSFGTRDTGWIIEDIRVSSQAAFFMVSGRFLETSFDGFVNAAGEAFQPIVHGNDPGLILTENRVGAPVFTTRETPFRVSALPGKTYLMPLNLHRNEALLEVRVEPVN